MSVPALCLQDVTCRFAGRGLSAQPYTAVEGVRLSVEAGEFLSVVGPTGCGKSTLLNMAAGLLQPSAGTVQVDGRPLSGINRRAGYLFQSDALLPWRNARANVATGLDFRGIAPAEARAQAQRWLERVGLGRAGERFPHQLSGGMRKRVALAQMLILNPALLLMDEPFSALDVQTRQHMENELLAIWQADRKAVLFITHDLEEAIALSDRVVVLSAGPASRVVGEFLIDLPRPRDVAEIRLTSTFLDLHRKIWGALRAEVMKAHEQNQA